MRLVLPQSCHGAGDQTQWRRLCRQARRCSAAAFRYIFGAPTHQQLWAWMVPPDCQRHRKGSVPGRILSGTFRNGYDASLN